MPGGAFLSTLSEETRRRAIAVVIPGGDVTTQLVLEHRSALGRAVVAGPSLQAFERSAAHPETQEQARGEIAKLQEALKAGRRQ